MMINKSTDITTTKHLDMYISYVTKEGVLKTHFLYLISLIICNLESITEVLVNIFKKKKILSKLVSFASNDASVILGKNKDIAAKLSRVCTYPLIINHYMAHRLTLAYKDMKKEVKFYGEVKFLVKKIYT